MAKLPEKPPFDIGEVLEWMDSPVAIIGQPWIGRSGMSVSEQWLAKACYLRVCQSRIEYEVGQEITFTLTFATLWTKPLTDEEAALAARLLLLDG
jgi:hypothetical protein